MNTKWRDLSIARKVLIIASGVVLIAACLCFILSFMDGLAMVEYAFWVLLCVSGILKGCINWKAQPISSTVLISMWCVLLGMYIMLLLSKLLWA